MAISKCPCLTFSAAMSCLDTKISLVPSIVPHSTFNLIGPCNTHPNRQSHKATKIHTLRPLTYELFFQKSSKKKYATEVILVRWFGKCQSNEKVGSRRFVEGLYQALFSFRLCRRNVIYKAKRK